jgi:hypothetical protein
MIRGIIYIAVFATGCFLGGLFPSFSIQYHQRLEAQYDQVSIDLAPFEEIANRYHGGDLEALVQHHLNSTDPTFHAEGEAIQLMIDSQAYLAESKAAASSPYVDQAVYFYRHMDDAVGTAVLDGFVPTLVTTENAITFALTIGTVTICVFWLLWNATSLALRRAFAARLS